MPFRFIGRFAAPLVLALAPLSLAAEVLSNTNPTIRDSLCVGSACADDETSILSTSLDLRGLYPQIAFVSTAGSDWRLSANLQSGGPDLFYIEQLGSLLRPLTIEAQELNHAFYIAAGGNIGLGTMLPQAEMHITGKVGQPEIRLETFGAAPYVWQLGGGSGGFFLQDISAGPLDVPFEVRAGAGNNAFVLQTGGDLGLGLQNPAAPLHIQRNATDGTTDFDAGILVETTGTRGARGLLTLRNQGQVFFGLEDTSIPAGDNSGRLWNFQNLGGEFRVTTAPGGGDDIEMRLDVNGNMIIEGNYFASSGQQLNVPDYVFAPDYDLKPLSEVQAFIAEHSHLPGIPSAAEINAQGLNMTDMQMRLLQKVEELTLYTLEQEARLARVDALEATNDELVAANAALVAEVADLRALVETALTPE